MRWNDPTLSFSRAVRWLLALWGDAVVPARVSDVVAGLAVGCCTGAVFALLWGTADFLGRKIQRERAAAWAAYEAENP